MRRSRLILALLGLTIGLGVVTGALAATLIFDDDDDNRTPERTSPNIARAGTPAPTATPSIEPEPEKPAGLPDDVWTALQSLPDKLRNQLIEGFESGTLDAAAVESALQQYGERNQGVRIGTVLEATDSLLRLEVYTTGEQAEVAIDEETVLRRGQEDIEASDLEPNELVMVLSMDGGETAFAVTAFGVGAP